MPDSPADRGYSKLALAGLLLALAVSSLTMLLAIGFSTSRSDGRGFLLIYAALAQMVGLPLVLVIVVVSLLWESQRSWLTTLTLVILVAPGLMAVLWFLLF